MHEMSLRDSSSSPPGEATLVMLTQLETIRGGRISSLQVPWLWPLEVLTQRLGSLSRLSPTSPSGPLGSGSTIGLLTDHRFCRMPIWATQCSFFYFFFFFLIILFILFIYFWLCWIFVAVHRLSLVVVSGGYSLLWCMDFSLRWLLLLWSRGSSRTGFSSCGSRAQ